MLIHDYNPEWPGRFRRIRDVIAESLDNPDITIEHIGSTAVPGFAAKPIIDIDIVFGDYADFADIKSRLELIGYFHNGDQGIPGREAFKRDPAAVKHDILDTISHHLYACPADSAELRRHLLFRDHLRRNARARQEYRELKLELARETDNDRKKYAALKEARAREFVLKIVEREMKI
ncbi:MAG: GrpB family protein [Spirochaetales bacterium]|nr:GrpB family protein [Spirochaetales bacterium]